MTRILIVDNEAECRTLVKDALESAGYTIDQASDGKKAVSTACVYTYDLVMLNIDLPKRAGVRALRAIMDECPDLPIVVIGNGESNDALVQALRAGAHDYLLKPLNPDIVRLTADRALAHRKLVDQNEHLLDELKARYSFEHAIGVNPAAKQAYQMALEIAGTDSAVLIRGECGTGKEHFARAIHYHSSRAAGPFVKTNCGAVSAEALEMELFGREKGVTKEALSRKIGAIEIANGGTVFLDEIHGLSADMEDKLLRLLLHHEYERVGGSRTLNSNVRIIASTSADAVGNPEQATALGDLRDYLNVFTIHLPPLRERLEDIPAFVHYFVTKYATATGKSITGVADVVMQQILACEWKGNVRELENCLERSIMQCDGSIIQSSHISLNGGNMLKRKQNIMKPLRDVERDHIRKVLAQCNWNKSSAANVLEIDRKTLRCKIREFGFEQPQGQGIGNRE
jgi:DNA-binding NtrC family response regulator